MPQYITTIIQIPRHKDGSRTRTTDYCLLNTAGYSMVLPVEEYGAKRIIK